MVDKDKILTINRSTVSGGNLSLPLNFSVVQGPSHGSATTVNGNDSWLTYTPLSNYIGRDTFTFKAIQYKNTSNIGNVTVAVVEAPLQINTHQNRILQKGNILTIDRSVVSGGITSLPLNFSVVQGPSHGSATTAVNGH